jgi:SnoaL-like domain
MQSLDEKTLTIRNTLADYCIALDDQNFDLLRSVFTNDTTADYSAVTPGSDPLHGVDAIIAKVETVLKDRKTQHALSTQKIEFQSDGSAEVRTYFTANTFTTAGEYMHFQVFGYYQDRLVDEGDGKWRIMTRTVGTHVSTLI